MKIPQFLKLGALTISLLLATGGMAGAQVLNHNEVEFTGTVGTIYPGSEEGVGSVDVVVSGTTLKVLADADTEITSGESEITFSDLSGGDVVKIEGKFSSEGVLASSIEKLTSDADNGFEVRGQITEIQTTDSTLLISIAGITVIADKSMQTSGRPSTRISVTSLTVGTAVSIEGTTTGDTWTATSIHVLTDKSKRKNVVRFEGTIVEPFSEGLIYVLVEGTETPQPVVLGPHTKTCGTLAVGAVVEVKGKLNAELKVEADVVCVIGALEIKPDHLKLKVGMTESMTVKLRDTASSDVMVNLAASSGVITLSAASVVIPQGSKVAAFSVTAGPEPGDAIITASANGQDATASVLVGLVSDSENENPKAAVRVLFAPDHIKMGRNDARDVVLVVQPPQARPLNILLEVTGDLASAEVHRELGDAGAAVYKVTVKSKADAGAKNGSVIVTLPDVADSGKAELVVEITDKGK